MIFATVGTQLPFPRLVKALDQIAPTLTSRVVAQIGDGADIPSNIEHYRSLPPARFDELFQEAQVIVGHAGIGTYLAARKYRKAIVIVPRRAALGEHRNDHQLATARQLAARVGVYVAHEPDELKALLLRHDLQATGDGEPGEALVRLRAGLRRFLTERAAVLDSAA